MTKLNLGCGPLRYENWVNIDADPNARADVFHDLALGIPYKAESVDAIWLGHSFDHFDLVTGLRLLGECFRVLKPQAPIRLSVMDLDLMLASLRADDMDKFAYMQFDIYSKVKSQSLKYGLLAFGALGGAPGGPYMGHRQVYDWEGLREILSLTGFVDVTHQEADDQRRHVLFSDLGPDMYSDQTIYVQCRRPR